MFSSGGVDARPAATRTVERLAPPLPAEDLQREVGPLPKHFEFLGLLHRDGEEEVHEHELC